MRNFYIIFISLFLLSACYNAPDKLKPAPWIFSENMPQDAPNVYKKGWQDGCESGLSSMTNTFYKTFYSFKQDSKLLQNATYYKVWKDTYTFCRHYAYGIIRESDQRMSQPNAKNELMSNFMGTEGIFVAGPLAMHGPGQGAAQPFRFMGNIGGEGSDTYGMGGTIDFSDDAAINGIGGGEVFNWNY